MSNKWHKFLQLPFPEKCFVVTVISLQPLFRLALLLIGLRRFKRILLWCLPSNCRSGKSGNALNEQLDRTASLVNSAARHGLLANCLSQSLTLWWLLKRRGINSDLRIGVRKNGDDFQAHAWIEYQGRVLNDAENVSAAYSPFEESVLRFGSGS